MFLNMKCAKIRVFHRLIFKMWGAKVKSIESNFLQSSVIATDECRLKLQTHLAKRKGVIDFETLGRTLAYSPFLPRFEREFFARARASLRFKAILMRLGFWKWQVRRSKIALKMVSKMGAMRCFCLI